MKSFGSRLGPKLANEYECTSCLACENICPKRAISHYLEDDGHIYVKIDPGKCIDCLQCQSMCEKSRISFGENDISLSSIYAAWTENETDRFNATSGGVFAAVARTVLESGGCVIGAELNGFNCKHTAIYSVDDIHRLQGSKYIASSMEDVYRIITEELPHRDVLFSGLGCQCAGVLAYFDGFNTEHTLYTVDLVCGGVPSRILIDKFKDQYPDVLGFFSFRSKAKYELRVKTNCGVSVIKEKSLPLHGFNCGLTNRYSCHRCQFAKTHRKTDITIGDLWGSSLPTRDKENGVSMVILHSPNGKSLFLNSKVYYETVNWEDSLRNNYRVFSGSEHVFKYRKKIVDYQASLNAEKFRRVYTMDISIDTPILFSFRIYRYIVQRSKRILRLMQLRKILLSDREK